MKSLKSYINEAATVKFDLDVIAPFDAASEKNAQRKFKITTEITMSEVTGTISDSETDVTVTFSNGDMIEYTADRNVTMSIETAVGETVKLDNKADDYMGSTGSVVGDLALVYKDWKAGKIRA